MDEITIDENLALNGDQNLGRLQRYLFDNKINISATEQKVISAIARLSIGYCNPIAMSKSGSALNSTQWAEYIGISLITFKRSIKSLSEKELISTIEGSHFRTNGGSYPNRYGINFKQTKESNIYFNLNGIKLTNFGNKTKTKEELVEQRLLELKNKIME